jgi:hypothetical protein
VAWARRGGTSHFSRRASWYLGLVRPLRIFIHQISGSDRAVAALHAVALASWPAVASSSAAAGRVSSALARAHDTGSDRLSSE